MTGGAVVVVALLIAFLIVGEYARKVRISGRLVETSAQTPAPGGRNTAQDAMQGAQRRMPVLEAELLIPEHSLASIDVGAEVLLRFPAYPHQRYGQYRGRILRISRTPIADEAAASAGVSALQTSRYRAAVSLERQRVRDDRGVERDLRPGLGVMADIVVEKRALYRWLFEPLTRIEERIRR